MVHAPEEKPSFTAADAQTAVNDLGRSRGLHNGVPTTTAGAAAGGAATGGGGSGASAGEMEEPAPVVDPELFDDYEVDSEDDDDDNSGGEGGARGGAPLSPGPGLGPGFSLWYCLRLSPRIRPQALRWGWPRAETRSSHKCAQGPAQRI